MFFLCYVMFVMLCYAMLHNVTLRYVTLRYVTLCHIALHCVTLRYSLCSLANLCFRNRILWILFNFFSMPILFCDVYCGRFYSGNYIHRKYTVWLLQPGHLEQIKTFLRGQRGRVVRVPDLKSWGPGIKSRSDNYLELFHGSPEFNLNTLYKYRYYYN